jgi:hypothetical protein
MGLRVVALTGDAAVKVRYPRAPRVRLEVSDEKWAEIVDRAIPKDSSHCVWADLIKECVPWATFISVDIQTIRITDRDRQLRYVYLTPRAIQEGIVDFDAGLRPDKVTVHLSGGAVHRSGRNPAPQPRTAAQQEASRRAGRARTEQAQRRRATLVQRSTTSYGNPEVIDGKTPPEQKGRFGRRRNFGIRGLEK